MRFIYIIVYFLFSKNFYVINFLSLKVLDANYGCLMWDYLGYDSQLWFWDGAEIHSKKYPNFVLDVDSKIAVENGWSRLTLFPKACGLKRNQWKIEGTKPEQAGGMPPEPRLCVCWGEGHPL